MPIITFHVVDKQYSDALCEQLLTESCRILSETLDVPLDRTRAFLALYPSMHAAVGGQIVEPGQAGAPFFSFYMGVHRPREHVPVLLRKLTDLVESTLGVDRGLIRAHAQPSDPADWGVAGEPMTVARADEMTPPPQRPPGPNEQEVVS